MHLSTDKIRQKGKTITVIMTLTSTGDYINTFFTHDPLDQIRGEPNYAQLKKLKKQLKSNAQAVPSTLGGGNNGLLGLVLSTEEYARVPGAIPLVTPTRPGPLTILPLTASHDIIRLQQEHTRTMETFLDCQAVEIILKKQIVAALPSDYLKEITDRDTGRIVLPVSGVLAYLFERYGQVEAETLHEEEEKLATYYWDPKDPSVLMYKKIEDLVDLATATGIPKTDAQIVNLGITLIKKTNDFETALLNWYNRHPTQQTYAQFKTHFNDAQQALKKVRGKKMFSTSFHQANQVEQLQNDMSQMRDELVTSINSIADHHNDNEATAQGYEMVDHAANATTSSTTTDALNLEMLRVLQQMSSQLTHLSTGSANSTSDNRRTSGNRTGGYKPRRNTSKYCWSHGACAHSGNECNAKKPGHDATATFSNKNGGSTDYCN